MSKKNISTDRILALYKGKDITFIAAIQAANNTNDIKQLFNKPNLSDSTAKAYQRLANQYVNLMVKPSIKDLKHIEKKENVKFSKDYHSNLTVLDNKDKLSNSYISNVKDFIEFRTNNKPVWFSNNKNAGYKIKIPIHNWYMDKDKIEGMLAVITSKRNEFTAFNVKGIRLFVEFDIGVGSTWISSQILAPDEFIDVFKTLELSQTIMDDGYYEKYELATYATTLLQIKGVKMVELEFYG